MMSPLPGLKKYFHFPFSPRLSPWATLCRPPRRAFARGELMDARESKSKPMFLPEVAREAWL